MSKAPATFDIDSIAYRLSLAADLSIYRRWITGIIYSGISRHGSSRKRNAIGLSLMPLLPLAGRSVE